MKRLHPLLATVLLTLAEGHAFAQTAEIDTVLPLEEVVKTGTRTPADERFITQTVTQISRQEIEGRMSTSLLDVVEERTPGLFHTARGVMGYGVSTGGSGSLTIRGIGGSPNSELMVLIDGHPQYMAIMGHPIADAYLSTLAEKVEVLKGPASCIYGGGAMGGVVNVITRQKRDDGCRTDVVASGGSYGSLRAEASNLLRAGNLWSVVAVNYRRSDGHRKDMGFEQIAGYAKVGYDFSPYWKAFVDVDVTRFKASNPGASGEFLSDNDQWITRGVTSLAVEDDYGKISGGATLYLNWGNHKIDDGYGEDEEPTLYYFRSHDHTLGINLYECVSFFEGNRLTVGLDWQSIAGHAWNAPKSGSGYTETCLVDTTLWELAGYADVRQNLWGNLTVEAGLRVDHHSAAGTELIPQFGLALRLPGNMEVKLTAARGFRNPTLKDLFMFTPANSELNAESIWNYEAALRGKAAGGRLTYGVNFYYLKGDNLIETVGGKNVNTGEIQNWGAEVEADWKIDGHWRADTNYSFIHSKNHIVATPKHKWYGEAEWYNDAVRVAMGVEWINHLVTQVDEYERSSYVLLNARVAYRVDERIEVFATGENLLAEDYEINYGYTMPRATATVGVHATL